MKIGLIGFFLFSGAALSAAGCSSTTTAGAVADSGTPPKGDSGTPDDGSTTPPADAGGPDKRCAPDGGFNDNACDACENAGCCATRFACYDNASCTAANMAFDDCNAAATGDGGPADAGAALAKCWSDFSASGVVAKARVDCQRTKCKTECEVP